MTDPSAEQQHPQWVFFGKHFKELPFIIHEHYNVINAPLTLLMMLKLGSVQFCFPSKIVRKVRIGWFLIMPYFGRPLSEVQIIYYVFFSDFISLLFIRIAGWVQLDSGRTRKFAFILRVELIKRSQWVLLQTQQMTRAPAHQLCKMIKMMRRVSINFLTCTVDLIIIKMSISLLLQNIILVLLRHMLPKKS